MVEDVTTWARWMFSADRRVAFTEVPNTGGVCVSTVFLGLDHGFGMLGAAPVLFESMAFGPPVESSSFPSDLAMDRYSTWEEAEEGHARMVHRLQRRLAANDK